jgi:hypothetical protein
MSTQRDAILHESNALHRYCRLRDRGLNEGCARARALEWEALQAELWRVVTIMRAAREHEAWRLHNDPDVGNGKLPEVPHYAY